MSVYRAQTLLRQGLCFVRSALVWPLSAVPSAWTGELQSDKDDPNTSDFRRPLLRQFEMLVHAFSATGGAMAFLPPLLASLRSAMGFPMMLLIAHQKAHAPAPPLITNKKKKTQRQPML